MLQGKGIISNFHQEIIKAFSQLPNAQQWKTEMIKPAEAKDIKLFFSALAEKIMNKISEKGRQ